MTTVINDLAKNFDNKGEVDTYILDFEKAFDTTPHELSKKKTIFENRREFDQSNPYMTYKGNQMINNEVIEDGPS